MKLYSVWQPLTSEDARTALVFGFLRHAPVDYGLTPWLSDVLGRPISAVALRPEHFWPRYISHVDGHQSTEPELVFDAVESDGRDLAVIVEAKPGYGMHRVEQLTREVVDTARGKPAERLVLIAVGADVGVPADIEAWRGAVRNALDAHGLKSVEAELHYSSWARLGRRIEECAANVSALSAYAEDAIAQLRFNALLGYEGAPVHNDLEALNLTNAVVLFNRAMAAARQFYLTLHDQPAYRATGLGPVGNSYQMLRNGASTGLSQHEESFQVSTLISLYRRPEWEPGLGAYAAFYFEPDDEPHLDVGAYVTSGTGGLHWDYEWSGGVEDLRSERLLALDRVYFPLGAASERTEWTYDARPWRAGQGDPDVTWAAEKLAAVVAGLR